MKTLKPLLLLLLSVTITFSSCRTEDEEFIDPPVQEALVPGSALANLMKRTALKDGSLDNIIDRANCLSIQLPVTITVNGTELTIDDEDGYEEIEEIFEDFDDDEDLIVISYPITVILDDYATQTINSDDELANLAATCRDENEIDDDIECIDFQYPITASVFNENDESADTIVINNDSDMYDFIDDLDEYDAVTINFPITLILIDGSQVSVANIQDLQREIELADNSCDEDDDYDYDDDDCENCSTDDLDSLFAECAVWRVGDFERNDQDLEEEYMSYSFSFNSDGTITASENGTVLTGSWSASGSGSNIEVVFDIPDLTDFNGTWKLEEIEVESDEVEIEFYLGDDELSFYSTCSSENTSGDSLSDALTAENAVWIVTRFEDEGIEETEDFQGSPEGNS